MSLGEKIKEFSKLGIDVLVLNSFDNSFLQQTPREFLDQLYERIPIKTFVVGFNFRFGYKGLGDVSYLKKESEEKKLNLISVPSVQSGGEVVSSTLIRRKIQEGKVKEVTKLLTRPYTISGKVIHGFGRGKSLGFPTANLRFSSQKVIPAYGVYLTKCLIKGRYHWGLTNIGTNPTFTNNRMNIETYLLDCNKDLYGQSIKISFVDLLRSEVKFDSPEALSRQMHLDKIKAQKLIYKKH